ncbi:hypothetical protein AGOR_G00057700 [Albula goreensis]|uniref:Uncharacterized protein n=1 Tax=Albula goreensis TaxID=1534307 RepID=A0A8T3DPR4_9TELE|nr:hypothetical protein AGOR_G00057700 [Albula goreensis]
MPYPRPAQFLCCSVMAAPAPIPSPAPADPSDPEVQACASFALESLQSQDPAHHYTITRFHSVTRADIGGGQYDMEVEVSRTLPSGEEELGQVPPQPLPPGEEELGQVPPQPLPPEHQQLFLCRFVVLSAPWKLQRVLLQSSCTRMPGRGPDQN